MHTFSAYLTFSRYTGTTLGNQELTQWTMFTPPVLLPPRCSTVKHIFFNCCSGMPHNFWFALCQAPITLGSLTLRANTNSGLVPLYDADTLVHELCSSQSDSLATLVLYGPFQDEEISGYRCNVYRNEKLSKARKLKTVAINVADVAAACFYRTGAVDVDMEDYFYDTACDETGVCNVMIGYEQQHEFFVK